YERILVLGVCNQLFRLVEIGAHPPGHPQNELSARPADQSSHFDGSALVGARIAQSTLYPGQPVGALINPHLHISETMLDGRRHRVGPLPGNDLVQSARLGLISLAELATFKKIDRPVVTDGAHGHRGAPAIPLECGEVTL